MASALCADVLKAADLFKPPPSSPIYSTACNLAQQAAAGIRAYNFTGLLDHDAKVSGAAFQRDRGLRHLHDQRQSHSHLRRRRPSPCEAGCLRRAASVEPLRQLPAANHVSSSAAASSAIRRSMDTRGSSSPRSSTLPWCSRHAAHRTRAVRPAGFWHRMRQASSSHPAQRHVGKGRRADSTLQQEGCLVPCQNQRCTVSVPLFQQCGGGKGPQFKTERNTW